MGVRITRLVVRRNGPLCEDFDIEPVGLNLVYGENETGKTYLLESILRFLFRTGKSTPWSTAFTGGGPSAVRRFPLAGKALVSLGDGRTVKFAEEPKTKDKLDDRYAPAAGLPGELSRIVVVRAGRTRLSENSPDGVGRDVLSAILGGGDVLDEISGRSGMPQYAKMRVSEGSLAGNREKARRDHEMHRKRLDLLQKLLDRSASNASAVRLTGFRADLEEVESELRLQEQARAEKLHRLGLRRGELAEELESLPSEEEVFEIRARIGELRRKLSELDEAGRRAAGLKEAEENVRWLEEAVEAYGECVSEGAAGSAGPMWMPAMAALLVAGAVAAGIARIAPLAIVAGLGAVALTLLYGRRAASRRPAPQQMAEQEKIAGEYARRFGGGTGDMASLKARLESLREERWKIRNAVERVRELEEETSAERRAVEDAIARWPGGCTGPEAWDDAVRKTLERVRVLDDELQEVRMELSRLGCEEEEVPPAPEGGGEVEYDRGLHMDLRRRRDELRAKINALREDLSKLAGDIRAMTEAEDPDDWEGLMQALRRTRAEALDGYREQTAELLAGIAVQESVSELRRREMERLSHSLADPVVGRTLRSLTGHYDGIRLEEDGGLTLGVEGEYDYPLELLSTGAREQVFLALRSAIAELTFGQPAFLLLDDAFQHSDYGRRERLVKHSLRLVEDGWQLFYFCMDEHIRDLFGQMGGRLGDEFREYRLQALSAGAP